MTTAYDEILDFVTSAPTLRQIVEFTHSAQTLTRVAYLMDADTAGTATEPERDELREFRKAAYFIEQLKVRAWRRLSSEAPADLPTRDEPW